MSDRRAAPRTRVDLFFNKYIDGYPHLCRTIDVSESGMLLERVSEPETARDFYPVEIGLMRGDTVGERVWLWAKEVWSEGGKQALKFVGIEERELRTLRRMLEAAEVC